MYKKILYFFLFSLIGISAYFSFFHSSSLSSENKNISIIPQVKTISISPTKIQRTEEFSGFVQGVKQADIAPSIPGYVIRLMKEEGETVYQGETIALLESKELSATEKSTLEALNASDQVLQKTKKYYDQKVDEAKASFDTATNDVEKISAEEALKSAKRLRDTQIATAKAQKTNLEGTLFVSRENVSRTYIKAPFTGIITAKNTSLGSYVAPGTPLYSLASAHSLEVVLSVPSSLVSHIKKGTSVSVVDGTKKMSGVIYSFSSVSKESSQRSSVHIRLENNTSSNPFSLSEYVKVILPIGEPSLAFLVPETALISQYDDTFLFIVENAIAKKHSVTLGNIFDGKREILSGIDDKMHIITEGQYTIKNNQSVSETYVTE